MQLYVEACPYVTVTKKLFSALAEQNCVLYVLVGRSGIKQSENMQYVFTVVTEENLPIFLGKRAQVTELAGLYKVDARPSQDKLEIID